MVRGGSASGLKQKAESGPDRDRWIVRTLSGWFSRSARRLPWRTSPRKAYPALVSEFMLQQTQVSRVLEKFGPFLARFDSVDNLARADEADVLAAWSGLGYYRRARLLHACAKAIAGEHGGEIPRTAGALEELPGIGRYTAGAIASIVFGERAVIVDGNVCRVLQRLDARRGHAGDKKVTEWAWKRAAHLVSLTSRGKQIARFNEGLMELGATVCTPDSPRCGSCPLGDACVARARGLTDEIPAPKPRAKRSIVHHDVAVVHRLKATGGVEYLLEQRPTRGLWAGMWQPPAREGDYLPAKAALAEVLLKLGLDAIGGGEKVDPIESTFQTTHREVRFRAWPILLDAADMKAKGKRWVAVSALATIGISNAHRRLLERVR